MADRAAITTAIETYCRVQSEKDRDGWAALFTEDAFHEDPVGVHGQTRGKVHVVGPFWDSIVRNEVNWLTDKIIVRGTMRSRSWPAKSKPPTIAAD